MKKNVSTVYDALPNIWYKNVFSVSFLLYFKFKNRHRKPFIQGTKPRWWHAVRKQEENTLKVTLKWKSIKKNRPNFFHTDVCHSTAAISDKHYKMCHIKFDAKALMDGTRQI